MRKEAAAELGTHGQAMLNELEKSMDAHHRAHPLTEGEQGALREMLMDPGAIRLMHRLVRATASGAPPSSRVAPTAQEQEQAKAKAFGALAVLDEEEWNRTKKERMAAARPFLQ